MTRKDYELIAASVRRSLQAHGIGNKSTRAVAGGDKALRLVAVDLAASLEHENPRFDRARFLSACGVQA
jgi:hypothetical protein